VESTQPQCSRGTASSFPGIKQPDGEDNQSFPSIAGVTNACGYTQYAPPHTFVARAETIPPSPNR
jgi:hypothetical protein